MINIYNLILNHEYSVYIAYKKNSITKLMLTFILDKIKAEGEYYSAQNFFDEQS